MTLIISMALMGLNIILLILDFIFFSEMAKSLLYANLVWIMVSTPILLYIAMKAARKRIERDAK